MSNLDYRVWDEVDGCYISSPLIGYYTVELPTTLKGLYENDIVKIHTSLDTKHVGVIKMIRGCWSIVFAGDLPYDAMNNVFMDSDLLCNWPDAVVGGDIHTSPELLEVEE